MWVKESRLWFMTWLGEKLADEDTDTKVWMLHEEADPYTDATVFADIVGLDKSLLGTWTEVFGGTLDIIPAIGPDFNIVAYAGRRQTFENETDENVYCWGFAILCHGLSMLYDVRQFGPPMLIGPGQKFKFTPYIRCTDWWAY